MKSNLCMKFWQSKFAMLLICFIMGGVFAVAQTKTVKGTVIDGTGEPVIGANIVVNGTNIGAITDIDGKFSLSNVPNNATVKVTFIGYAPQEVSVSGKTNLNITLSEENDMLDEVVVIGYGTVRRRDLTGSVASVNGDKLVANPVTNVAQALQGQLPGVSVVSQDGRPGASMSIRVRGGGSITQSNEPLYIVDGVQVSSIDDIPADNIESIDVLKDAASTAIYGARGANGVILVTTKGAKEGKAVVKYAGYYQVKEKPQTLDVLDGYDYVRQTWSQAAVVGESYADGVAKYFGLGSKYGNNLENYRGVSSHNYVEDILRSSSAWNHDLSVSGGTEKTKIYASINYLTDEGARINTGFRRMGANIKLDQKINKRLSFNADLRYVDMEFEGTKFDVTTSAYKFRPIDNPLGDATHIAGMGQGSANVEEGLSPLDIINNYDNVTTRQRVRARSGLTWEIIDGLTAKTELSLSRNWSETQNWDAGLENGYSTAKLTKGDGYGVRWATTLNYQVQGLGKDNNLSFLVGNEVLSSKSNSSVITGAGYPDGFTKENAFGMINMTDPSLGKDAFSNTIGTPTHTNSFFGRANYSYKGRYLLTATFRADGSSKFAENNQWGYFPAAAAAWRISDEGWMEDASEWLDNLKLRVSYGTSGSDNIDPSLWKETWTTKSITVDGQPVTVYIPGEMQGNPDLKWETTTSRNVGIDFAFLNSRIRGSVDAYWNSTDDILMKVPVDASAGYSYQFQNVGETSNKGIELALGADIVRSDDFNLSVNVTYNFNRNKIEELDESAFADTHTGWGSTARYPYYDYVIREGKPVGTVQGFVSDGFYTLDDFDYANGVYTLKAGVPDIADIVNYTSSLPKPDGQVAFPGAEKYKDTNKDGVINGDDVTIIGEMMPEHTGGFSLSGNYKSLDFSANFTYQIGGKVYNANAMHSLWGNKDNDLGANRLAMVKDCFKLYAPDANGDLQMVTDPDALRAMNRGAKYAVAHSEYAVTASQFIEDASYLRLQTLTIGYTLPREWMKKIGVQNCRIYATGSNLFCLTGYSGLDPDVNTNYNAGGDGFPTPNYDYNAYPKTRSYTFGLNVTF